MLNQPLRAVGIAGYGAYVPRYRLPGSEISRVWTEGNSKSPVREKAVPGLDEDTATMSIEAARNAMARAGATHHFGSDNFVTGGTPMVLNQGGFGGRGAPKRIVTAPEPALYDYWRGRGVQLCHTRS